MQGQRGRTTGKKVVPPCLEYCLPGVDGKRFDAAIAAFSSSGSARSTSSPTKPRAWPTTATPSPSSTRSTSLRPPRPCRARWRTSSTSSRPPPSSASRSRRSRAARIRLRRRRAAHVRRRRARPEPDQPDTRGQRDLRLRAGRAGHQLPRPGRAPARARLAVLARRARPRVGQRRRQHDGTRRRIHALRRPPRRPVRLGDRAARRRRRAHRDRRDARQQVGATVQVRLRPSSTTRCSPSRTSAS